MSVKVVCISDTHTYHKSVEVPDGDILVHAGDSTFMGREAEIVAVGYWMRRQPHKYKFIISGNHDWGFQTNPEQAKGWLYGTHNFEEQQRIEDKGFYYLQDRLVTVNVDGRAVQVYGSPWQPWFHDWAFNLQRGAEIKEKWDLIPTGIDILITHGPPHTFMDKVYRGELVGCEELLAAVKRTSPKLHVFGHIHEGYGQETVEGTTFVNASSCTAGYSPTNKPIVVEI